MINYVTFFERSKGFFDPNTQENLTYLELIRRCQKEPDTGFHFLVLRQKRRREGRASRQSLWTPSHNYNQERLIWKKTTYNI